MPASITAGRVGARRCRGRGAGLVGGPGRDRARRRARSGRGTTPASTVDVRLGALDRGSGSCARLALRRRTRSRTAARRRRPAGSSPRSVSLDVLGAADLVHRRDPDLEDDVGIEEDVLEVAVLARDAQLERGRAVDVLGAEVLDAVALRAPVDERAVEVGGLRELARVVDRGALGIAAAAERRHRPRIRAVARADLGQALDRELGADPARAARSPRPNSATSEKLPPPRTILPVARSDLIARSLSAPPRAARLRARTSSSWSACASRSSRTGSRSRSRSASRASMDQNARGRSSRDLALRHLRRGRSELSSEFRRPERLRRCSGAARSRTARAPAPSRARPASSARTRAGRAARSRRAR